MYWKLFVDHLRGSGSGRPRLIRRGTVTELVIGLLVVGALLAQYEHHRGNYTRIKERLETPPAKDTTLRPGGLEPIVLMRTPNPGSPNPEFSSVTLLPGRGMEVLQITASLPSRGEVNLLAGGSVAEAAREMTGVGEDAAGEANLTRGGAFLTPWAGLLGGTLGADGKSVTAAWRGRSFTVPANTVESAAPKASGGLLSKAAAEGAETSPMPDGGSVTAVFPGGEHDGRWPSALETKVSVQMSSRVLDVTVKVRNVGGEAVPVGIGWAPRFAIPSGDRARAMLHVPAAARSVVGDKRTGMPSGELETLAGTAYEFDVRNGKELGKMSLDDTFVHLRAKFDQSPTVELRDPGSQMGLRLVALSPSIKAVHVLAPADAGFVSIAPQMNYDDPFGREWGKDEDTGMAVLAPGQAVEWKVRLELFSLMGVAAR